MKRSMVALFCLILGVQSFCWTKTAISNDELTSKYIEYFVGEFNLITSGKTWSDENAYGITNNGWEGVDMVYVFDAMAIAFYGSDAQVAETGLSREELLRRGKRGDVLGNGFTDIVAYQKILAGCSSRADLEAKMVTARELLNSGIRRSPVGYFHKRTTTWPGNFPLSAPVSFGYNFGMDYGMSAEHATIFMAPQDLSDPRLMGGKPIKEWIQGWVKDWDNGHNSFAVVEANYTPEFSSTHHGYINHGYAECPTYRHGPNMADAFSRLFKDGYVYAHDFSDLNHGKEFSKWECLNLYGNGLPLHPQTSRYSYTTPAMMPLSASTAANIYGQKEYKALEERLLERGIFEKGGQIRMAAAFFMHLLFGTQDSVMAYATASRGFHGTYYIQSQRYCYHRTPDKVVCLAWNAMQETDQGGMFNTALPYDKRWDALFSTRAMRHKFPGWSNALAATQIHPDNDALRPDSEHALVMSSYGMQGRLNASQDGNGVVLATAQSEIGTRFDNTDAVMSTAGKLNYMKCQYGSTYQVVPPEVGAIQYQSFTSFYDKTCISLMEADQMSSTGPRPVRWEEGFANAFSRARDGVVGYECSRVYCYFEGDSMNLLTNSGKIASPWWCVNGRLGVAVKGADHFTFNVKYTPSVIGEYGSTYPDRASDLAMISLTDTLAVGGSKLNAVAAAYFTDTPPDRVKYLQTTLIQLDSLLPSGWRGAFTETPDSQRVMALSRFYGDSATAHLRLSFHEGAPVFEQPTSFINDSTSSADFTFDTLQSFGQTVAFYVTGAMTEAVQIGDVMVKLRGHGSAVLKYLSRANNNQVYVDGVLSNRSKAELRVGLSLTLTDSWTVVRIENTIDDDHTGPSIKVLNPHYLRDEQCFMSCMGGPDGMVYSPQSDTVFVDDAGLDVKVDARDKSGIAWVDVYLDYQKIGRVTTEPFVVNIPKESLQPDSVSKLLPEPNAHTVWAVACDNLGHQNEGYKVPFRAKLTGGTAIERSNIPKSVVNGMGREIKTVMGCGSAMLSKKTPGNSTVLLNNDGVKVFRGRVKVNHLLNADSCVIVFNKRDDENYFQFGLDAVSERVVIHKIVNGKKSIVAEADQKIKLNRWYELKVRCSGNNIGGFVDGEEKIAVLQ